MYPVEGINCQRPSALAFESAFTLNPLSISGSQDNSTGRPAFLRAGTICGRYFPERLYASMKNLFFAFFGKAVNFILNMFVHHHGEWRYDYRLQQYFGMRKFARMRFEIKYRKILLFAV